MAVQLVNIGNIANDGTGDDLREAMIKINSNFEELALRDAEQTSGSNLGVDGESIFVRRNVYDLEFKKIHAGTNVTLTADASKIVIAADSGVSDLTITADTGNVVLDNSAALSIVGGTDITTSITGSVLTLAYNGITDLVSDTTPQLSADLDAQANNLLNVGTIATTGVTGPVTGNVTGNTVGTHTGDVTGNVVGSVHGIDIRTLLGNDATDFGNINPTVNNLLEYIIFNTDFEMGSFTAPNAATLDLGAIAV
jgi:uncharacterized membrane protein